MARVNLRNSYRYKGVMYHPGANVEVPDALARALGLDVIPEPVAAQPKPKAPRKAAPKADAE